MHEQDLPGGIGLAGQRLHTITAAIKAFERPDSLDRLIRSIRRYCPGLKVLVADDSFEPCPRHDVQYLRLEPDVGLSAGRNAMLRHIDTPYFLLLEDDMEFSADTQIELLAALVAQDTVDIAGGDLVRCKRKLLYVRRKPQHYHGLIEVVDGHLRLVEGDRGSGTSYQVCDIVPNFFVARTDQVLAFGGWDEELKLHEHEEFFVRAKRAGLRIGFCGDVRINHWCARPRRYSQYRSRDFGALAAEKMSIYRFTDFLGHTAEYSRRVA
jgi:GT2 family glycosyltransferase